MWTGKIGSSWWEVQVHRAINPAAWFGYYHSVGRCQAALIPCACSRCARVRIKRILVNLYIMHMTLQCIYLFYIYSMAKKDVNRLKIMLAVTKHSNKWLAEMLGKDQATISKWCTNTCQPDLETLIRISDLLKVDVNDLLNKECIKEWWTIYWNR